MNTVVENNSYDLTDLLDYGYNFSEAKLNWLNGVSKNDLLKLCTNLRKYDFEIEGSYKIARGLSAAKAKPLLVKHIKDFMDVTSAVSYTHLTLPTKA